MNKYYRLECPRCKSKMNEWELTSLPPQYECECSECRTKLNFYDREDPFEIITQHELNERFKDNEKHEENPKVQNMTSCEFQVGKLDGNYVLHLSAEVN